MTGGAGFLGSHLCDALVGRGDQVIVVDDLSTGSSGNIAHAGEPASVEMLRHDIVRRFDVAGPVDSVVHMASPTSPVDYYERPIQTLRAGAEGTRNTLELARRKGARFLLASTSEVYGDPREHPQHETYRGNSDPIGPRSVYHEAKRYAEALTMAYRREYDTSVRIVRIFNTYGPRMRPDDGRVVSNFIVQALRGEPLPVYGDGQQTRSFCYVSDLIRGILVALDGSDPGPFNLGNPTEITIAELARRVGEAVGSDVEVDWRAFPVGDPLRRCPDISRARDLLGWVPSVSLDEGLRVTVDWMRRQPDVPPARTLDP